MISSARAWGPIRGSTSASSRSREWAASAGRGAEPVPLVAETLLLVLIAYLAGVGIAYLLWGRPRRKNYLGDE